MECSSALSVPVHSDVLPDSYCGGEKFSNTALIVS